MVVASEAKQSDKSLILAVLPIMIIEKQVIEQLDNLYLITDSPVFHRFSDLMQSSGLVHYCSLLFLGIMEVKGFITW